MEYKFQEIAERIRELRKSKNLSQDGLIDLLSKHGLKIGRNTISSIENGVESAYTFAFLKTISKVFNCDIGYILGEYEEKTQEVHQMCLATGLSEKAIEKIQKISKKNHVTTNSDSLSLLVEDDDFEYFVSLLSGIICDEVNEINVDIGKTRTCIKSVDITDYSLSVSIRDISHRIKQAFDKRFPTTDDKYDFLMLKREFIFVESLYQENRISEDEYKGYIEELKKGNSVL